MGSESIQEGFPVTKVSSQFLLIVDALGKVYLGVLAHQTTSGQSDRLLRRSKRPSENIRVPTSQIGLFNNEILKMFSLEFKA